MATKKEANRPAIRSEVLHLRVTEEFHRHVYAVAAKEGRTVSDWCVRGLKRLLPGRK